MSDEFDIFNDTPTDEDMERRLFAVLVMALEKFSNGELCAFNLALDFPGRVPEGNCSYKPALEAALITEGGGVAALEETKRAAAYVINQRSDARTFE